MGTNWPKAQLLGGAELPVPALEGLAGLLFQPDDAAVQKSQ